MNQAEREGQQPAAFRVVAAKEVFDSDVYNRGSDEGFDNAPGELDEAESCNGQRDRVCDGEAGDDFDGGRKIASDDEKTEKEEQMIVTGPDVFDAHDQKISE